MNLGNLFGKKAAQPEDIVATPVAQTAPDPVENVVVKKAKAKHKKSRHAIERSRMAMREVSRRSNRGAKGHSHKR